MEYTLIRRTEGVCKPSITCTVCYSRMLSRLPAKSEPCGLCANFSVGLRQWKHTVWMEVHAKV